MGLLSSSTHVHYSQWTNKSSLLTHCNGWIEAISARVASIKTNGFTSKKSAVAATSRVIVSYTICRNWCWLWGCWQYWRQISWWNRWWWSRCACVKSEISVSICRDRVAIDVNTHSISIQARRCRVCCWWPTALLLGIILRNNWWS
jgi:hypothetical protein